MLIFFATLLCYSLGFLAIFGIALYLTAADNRRLRSELAEMEKGEAVATVAPRLREYIEPCMN